VLALASVVAGRANLAALEVHRLHCGDSGESGCDPSLANHEKPAIAIRGYYGKQKASICGTGFAAVDNHCWSVPAFIGIGFMAND
jgi:hypothetical protein